MRPFAIALAPQTVVLAFYGLLRLVWGNTDAPKVIYTGLAILALFVGGGWALFDCVDNVLPAYTRRKELEERERRELRRKIDREIGIPS